MLGLCVDLYSFQGSMHLGFFFKLKSINLNKTFDFNQSSAYAYDDTR